MTDSTMKKFAAFLRSLSASERKEITLLMAEWVAMAEPTAQARYHQAAGKKGDDMEEYASLRQSRGL